MTIKELNNLCKIVDKAKQKTIKRIIKRLNKMSPNDVQFFARLLKV